MASFTDNEIRGMDREKIKKYLFRIVMKSEWEKVVRTYRLNKEAHNAKIIKSGDTALHIAVSDGQDEIVERLVKLISAEDILLSKNERGNTPLHIAASMGNVRMCLCIAIGRPWLVGAQNEEYETPLFLAALSGEIDVFLCLHYICTPDEDHPKCYGYCRRKDGDTILHCAIAADYFDLAFEIMDLYGDLVNYVNEDGFSPLHILASKPSAFKSGSHLSGCTKIIYHCTYIGELKVERHRIISRRMIAKFKDKQGTKYPENYETCMNFVRLFWNMVKFVTKNQCQGGGKTTADAENAVEPSYKAAVNRGVKRFFTLAKQGLKPHKILTKKQKQGSWSAANHYSSCFEFFKLLSKAILTVLGLGLHIRRIRRYKEKHIWSVQVMNELLRRAYKYEEYGTVNPVFIIDHETHDDDHHGIVTHGQRRERSMPEVRRETPILIAAKNGITEMVEMILEIHPVAIHDVDAKEKNIVLLAVENRQSHVYLLLLQRNILEDRVFRKVDNEGNTALHLAAKLGDYKPCQTPGAALQMQWEIKWYKFVRCSMPLGFFARENKAGETAWDHFIESHKDLVQAGGEWLYKNSQSYFAVGGFVISVAFATAVPGGIQEATGKPILGNQPAFQVFAIASLVALCFSVISMMMFLTILTSQFHIRNFEKDLPRKLLVGLTSLFVSIASMLVSFCAGHFFLLEDKLKYVALPVYAITCLPVVLFALNHFPRYVDHMWTTAKKVPQRGCKEVAPLEGLIYV